MKYDAPIYIAGHEGLVGSALCRALKSQGYTNLITYTRAELDLRNYDDVMYVFSEQQPAYVFSAAAKVGGIKANNDYPADFIYDNLMIQTNVLHAAYRYNVRKVLFLGSSCIYPKLCPQPIKEDYLLTGLLEPTNQPYAVAKIAGITMCQAYNKQYGTTFIAGMPTNLYGPGDTFVVDNAHVIPGLIAKMHEAMIYDLPSVTVWGTGNARREFLYVDDLADALIFLMHHYTQSLPINIGVGYDITIKELACMIKDLIGYQGTLYFDTTYPDGTPQKLLDSHRLYQLGWRATTTLQEGLSLTYDWYVRHYEHTFSKKEERTYA